MDINAILTNCRSSNKQLRECSEKALETLKLDKSQIINFFQYISDINNDKSNKKTYFVIVKNYIKDFMVISF